MGGLFLHTLRCHQLHGWDFSPGNSSMIFPAINLQFYPILRNFRLPRLITGGYPLMILWLFEWLKLWGSWTPWSFGVPFFQANPWPAESRDLRWQILWGFGGGPPVIKPGNGNPNQKWRFLSLGTSSNYCWGIFRQAMELTPGGFFFVNLEKSHSSGPIAMKSCEYSPAFGGSTCLGA